MELGSWTWRGSLADAWVLSSWGDAQVASPVTLLLRVTCRIGVVPLALGIGSRRAPRASRRRRAGVAWESVGRRSVAGSGCSDVSGSSADFVPVARKRLVSSTSSKYPLFIPTFHCSYIYFDNAVGHGGALLPLHCSSTIRIQ